MTRAEAFNTIRDRLTDFGDADLAADRSEAFRQEIAQAGIALLEDFFFQLGTIADAAERLARLLENRP